MFLGHWRRPEVQCFPSLEYCIYDAIVSVMVSHWVGSLRISSTEKRPTGRPQLRFKDVRKKDLRAMSMNLNTWEALASASWPTSAIVLRVKKKKSQFGRYTFYHPCFIVMEKIVSNLTYTGETNLVFPRCCWRAWISAFGIKIPTLSGWSQNSGGYGGLKKPILDPLKT